MDLVEKLEKRAKQYNPWYGKSGGWEGLGVYNQQNADDRELLEEAAHRIRVLENEGVSRRVI